MDDGMKWILTIWFSKPIGNYQLPDGLAFVYQLCVLWL